MLLVSNFFSISIYGETIKYLGETSVHLDDGIQRCKDYRPMILLEVKSVEVLDNTCGSLDHSHHKTAIDPKLFKKLLY